MRDVNWIRAKAAAYVAGWRSHFSADPTPHNISLGLAVAWHETSCGDSAVARHNWGAVQKRKLRPDEQAALAAAGLVPQFPRGDFIPRARAALDAAIAAGDVPQLDREELFVDSSPTEHGSRWYWIMFWAFPNDDEGAALFLKVLAVNRASCRAVLGRPGSTAYELAAAMYGKPGSRYFEGVYKPDATYEQSTPGATWRIVDATTEAGGPRKLGAELNIGAYAAAINRYAPTIAAALVGWTPGEEDAGPPPAPDLDTVVGRQLALNLVGSVPTLSVDGDFGPQSRASTAFFQRAAALPVTGDWDADTVRAMRDCLARIPSIDDRPTDPEMHA